MTHGWLSLVPPLLAIGLALALRQVLLALLLGVWSGALILAGGRPVTALLRVADTYLVDALADRDHAAIVLFSLLLGGMVGILSRAGAMEGVVRALTGRVRDRRAAQTATAAMGTAIFFDDYANTLLVGNALRPLCDRLRVSRAKLAYLVDSTAAPVTSVAIVSTWIGFEVGLIQDAMTRLQLEGSGYLFFLRSLPYSFYPLLTLVFVYLVAVSGRDFGPMARAEAAAAAAAGGPARGPTTLQAVSATPASPWLGAVPILAVILVTIVGLWANGRAAVLAAGGEAPALREILNAADSLAVLMWASLGGVLVAGVLVRVAGRLSLGEIGEAWLAGAREMLVAMAILVLAWSLGKVCDELGTGRWLVDASRGLLSVHLLPAVTFLLAAAVSFSTGTSWGTMAILIPMVFPVAAALPAEAGIGGAAATGILLASVRAVLAGSVFGDHCSPLSDTTIMSSMASGCDHVEHVRTQMPYALVVAAAALAAGYLPAGFGLSPWLSLPLGVALLVAWLHWRGRVPVAMAPEGRR